MIAPERATARLLIEGAAAIPPQTKLMHITRNTDRPWRTMSPIPEGDHLARLTSPNGTITTPAKIERRTSTVMLNIEASFFAIVNTIGKEYQNSVSQPDYRPCGAVPCTTICLMHEGDDIHSGPASTLRRARGRSLRCYPKHPDRGRTSESSLSGLISPTRRPG